MQKGDLFTECNRHCSKYRVVSNVLDEHKGLLRWSKDEVILDVGCGPGDVTHNVLLSRIPDDACKYVVGVDISPTMKEYGFKNFPHPKLIFETLDMSNKNLDVIRNDPRLKDGFDKIFSFFTLHWIHDLKTALKNMYTLLKPGGQALFMFPIDRIYQRTFIEIQKRQPWSDLYQGVSRKLTPFFFSDDPAEEFVTLLKEAGFKVAVSKTDETEDEYENIETLKKLVESLDKFNSKIPVELKDKFLNECIEILRRDIRALRQTENGKVYPKNRKLIAFVEK